MSRPLGGGGRSEGCAESVRGPALDCVVDTDSPDRERERAHIDRSYQGGMGRVSVAASGISTVRRSTSTMYGTRTRKMDG